MNKELLCPVCYHPLALHSYFGVCQAHVGGSNLSFCGCEYTLEMAIRDEISKKEKLEKELTDIKKDHISLAHRRISKKERLYRERIELVKNILNEAKDINVRSLGGALVLNYKKKVHEKLDEAIAKLEEDNGIQD
jgi:hypothetical protein